MGVKETTNSQLYLLLEFFFTSSKNKDSHEKKGIISPKNLLLGSNNSVCKCRVLRFENVLLITSLKVDHNDTSGKGKK